MIEIVDSLGRPTKINLITQLSDDNIDEIQSEVYCCGPYIILIDKISGGELIRGVYTVKNLENGPKIIEVEMSNDVMTKFVIPIFGIIWTFDPLGCRSILNKATLAFVDAFGSRCFEKVIRKCLFHPRYQ